MRMYLLFELFLCLFCIYALFRYDGGTQISVLLICLITAFLFDMLNHARKKPDEKVEIVASIKNKREESG